MHIACCSPALLAMRLPDPVAFSVGGFSVYWTGIFLAAGILAALLIVSLEAKRRSLPPDTAVDLCLVLIPCGVVGARVVYALLNASAFAGDFAGVLRIWDGGLSLWGALLFCAAGLFVYARRKRLPFPRLLDLLAPGLALGQAIIVWGDFFNQQNYGRIVTNRALYWFPLAVRIERTGAIHYATFFYTFVLCAAIFLLIWCVLRRRARHDGEVFLWYALLLGAGVALIGFFGDIEGSIFGLLTIYQLICILLALLAAVLLFVLKGRPADEVAAADALEATDATQSSADPETPESAEAPAIECPGCFGFGLEEDGDEAQPDAAELIATDTADPADAPAPTAEARAQSDDTDERKAEE